MRIQVASPVEMKKRRRRFIFSIPIRVAKGAAGLLLFWPITMFSFMVVCFRQNQWPWEPL